MSVNPSNQGVRALDDAVLSASLWVSVTTAFINVGAAAVLVRRAFPGSFGRFISMDSAIRVMSSRCRLLFFANLLLLIDSLSNIAHFSSLREYKTANILANRLVYLATFPPSGPMIAVAAVQRSAMIVSQRPEVRLRLIRASQAIAIVIVIILETASIWATVELYNEGPRADLVKWVTTLYIPNSIAFAVAILPLMIVCSSMWALSTMVCRKRAKRTSSKFGRMATAVSLAVHGRSAGGLNVSAPRVTLPTSNTSASIAASAVSTSAPSSEHRSGSYQIASAQLRYPLSSTFVILSITLSTLWCLTLIFFAMGSFVGHARTYTVVNLIATLGVCTEAGFEKLLQLASRQQARKKQSAADQKLPRDMDTTMFDPGASAIPPRPAMGSARTNVPNVVYSPQPIIETEITSHFEAEEP